MEKGYGEDLAYIHDVGHSDYAIQSAPGILNSLAQRGLQSGLIVDLGCGSGWSALEFVRAGYQVLGVDYSEPLITLARARVPEAEFRVESLFKTYIPPCAAVTSVGECFNYLFDADIDADSSPQSLMQLFHRIYEALIPGGILMFDMAGPGQVMQQNPTRSFIEGEDWLVLVEKDEDREQATLVRRITTFRKIGDLYRRDDEVHRLRLYESEAIAEALRQIGFHVQVSHSYGAFELPSAHAAFIAHKPEY